MAETAAAVEVMGIHEWTVYPHRYRPKEGVSTFMVGKYRDPDGHLFVACGNDLPQTKDLQFRFNGTWTEGKYGRSLKVLSFETVLPTTEKAFVSYMTSLKIRIGKATAQTIWNAYGEGSWEIAKEKPEELIKLKGVSRAIAKKLSEKVAETQVNSSLMKLFSGIAELTAGKVNRLKKHYGSAEALTQIQNDPWSVCEVEGFSFAMADKLARKLKVSLKSDSRYKYAAIQVLKEAAVSGHTCIPRGEMLLRYEQLLNKDNWTERSSLGELKTGLNECISARIIKTSGGMIYLTAKFNEEVSVAENIARIASYKSPITEGVDDVILAYETESRITLAPEQREAVRACFKESAVVLTGGPGTGKTTVIKAILYAHRAIFENASSPIFLSPTGKAARRMTEATGFPAQTIHSAVGYKGDGHEETHEGTIDANLFVVDEASMMDLHVAYLLLKQIPDGARIIFIGDPNQLPSVGCGNVLADLIKSGVVTTVRLQTIFRQGEDSPIIANSKKMAAGDASLKENAEFKIFKLNTSEDIFEKCVSFYKKCVSSYGIENVILLNPYRSKTILSADNFNARLQNEINPKIEGQPEMRKDKSIAFRKGDRVMQMKNTETVRNGDVGTITNISLRPKKDEDNMELIAEIDFDGALHYYPQERIDELELAYCTTVHKSQGSEYQTVLVVLSAMHTAMFKRNIIYTAITRSRTNVAIFTEAEGTVRIKGTPVSKTAVDMAIENDKTDDRWSLLSERLRGILSQQTQ